MNTDYYNFNPVEAYEPRKRTRTLEEPLLDNAGAAEQFIPFASSSSSHETYVRHRPFSPTVPSTGETITTTELNHRPPTTTHTGVNQRQQLSVVDASKQPTMNIPASSSSHHQHQKPSSPTSHQHHLRDRSRSVGTTPHDRSSWAEVAKNEEKLSRGTTVTVTSPETKMYNPYSPKLLSGSRNHAPSTSDEVLFNGSPALPPFFQNLITPPPKHYGETPQYHHHPHHRHSRHSYTAPPPVNRHHPTYVSHRHSQTGYDFPRREEGTVRTHAYHHKPPPAEPRSSGSSFNPKFQLQPVSKNTMFQHRRSHHHRDESEDSRSTSGYLHDENKENHAIPAHRSSSTIDRRSTQDDVPHHTTHHRHHHHHHSRHSAMDASNHHHHTPTNNNNNKPRYWNSGQNTSKGNHHHVNNNMNHSGRPNRYDNNINNNRGNTEYSGRSNNVYSFPLFRSRKKNFTKPHQVRYAVMCVSALCDANNIILSNMVFGPNVLKIAIRSSAQLENIETTMKILIDMPEIVVEEVSVPSVDTVTKRKRGFLIFMKLQNDTGIEKVVALFADNGFKVNKVINPIEQTPEESLPQPSPPTMKANNKPASIKGISKVLATKSPPKVFSTPRSTQPVPQQISSSPMPQQISSSPLEAENVRHNHKDDNNNTQGDDDDDLSERGTKKISGLSITVPTAGATSPMIPAEVVVTTPLAMEHTDVMVDETTKSETGSEEEKDSSVVLDEDDDCVGNVMILDRSKENAKVSKNSYSDVSMVHTKDVLERPSSLTFTTNKLPKQSTEQVCTESIGSFPTLQATTISSAPSNSEEKNNIDFLRGSSSSIHSQFANRTSFSSFDDLDLEDEDETPALDDNLHHSKTKRKRRRRKKARKHNHPHHASTTLSEYLSQLPEQISLFGIVLVAIFGYMYGFSYND